MTLTSTHVRPADEDEAGVEKPTSTHQSFSDATVSFAVDISGSTYGQTLAAEQAFIRSISNLLSPRARFDAKILPWDDRAHPILSLAQVHRLEDEGGTDPRAILANAAHKASILRSSLWFLMTDGLIEKATRAKFASDVAQHGVHGISCVVVVFGNPSTGPASCDVSVGIGVFAAVPNCAFLFCNETNGDLRALQTKGTFNALLKGRPHPVFDASSRWDALPQVSVADFAAVAIPRPQRLRADEVALQDSLVIQMEDLFANRLAPEQIARIFANEDNLATVIMTSQARNQQDRFQAWVQQQTIRSDDPLFKPRADHGARAASLFAELSDLVRRGQDPPPTLRTRLRAAYRENMKRFVADSQSQMRRAEEREYLISTASAGSSRDIDGSHSLSSPVSTREFRSHHQVTPYHQSATTSAPMQPPGAPRRRRASPHRRSEHVTSAALPRRGREEMEGEEAWGSWEEGDVDASLRGLLYTPGLRSSTGSFKGTCPVCGGSGLTLAWLFRAISLPPPTPSTPGGTAGFPQPHSRSRLAFPLAMGHFAETAGVLASSPSAAPLLVCEPCSTFYARDGALSFGVTVALPLVRYAENRETVGRVLAAAFEGRFADADLPQVFLSVLLRAAASRGAQAPPAPTTSTITVRGNDVEASFAAAAAHNTFRAAAEWTAHDLLRSLPVLRELSESFSLPHAAPLHWPLGTVLAGSFEESEQGDGGPGETPGASGSSLLRYPLQGFVVMLRAAALVKVGPEVRRRATLRRLLYLLCEELKKAAAELPSSQSVAQLFGGLLGELTSPDHESSLQGHEIWHPADSVPVASLQLTPLLSAASYGIMNQADEFRYLQDPSLPWVGPAVAVFLYGLFLVVQAKPMLPAWETFEAVARIPALRRVLVRPEEVDRDAVHAMWSDIHV